MAAAESGPVTRETVLGVLSLILWALIIVVTIKYVLILLRADNNGEGGTLSLTALATRALGRRTPLVFLLGVIGASMFLGDSVITPAISVLSAVEGLKLVTPAFEHYVVPLTIVILARLVRGPEPRHRAGGELLRPGDGGLVRRDRNRRLPAHSRRSRRAVGGQSGLWDPVPVRRTARSAWSRSAWFSWWSPAARRSMPISAISGASRSSARGSASCCRR